MAKSLKRKRKDIPIKDSLELDKMMETILIVMYIQEDLVVSSKKLQELEIVFQNFTNLKKSVILVLIGPYGCGKTASAVLLGKKYNLNCVF